LTVKLLGPAKNEHTVLSRTSGDEDFAGIADFYGKDAILTKDLGSA